MTNLKITILLFSIFLIAGCAPVSKNAWQDPDAVGLTSERLQKFETEAEFEEYLKSLHSVAKKKQLWWVNNKRSSMSELKVAQVDLPCDPQLENCANALEDVIVTASKVTGSPQITNNQVAGVDEGDIVKLVGQFLVVLQDGRLFSVDTAYQGSDVVLVDRINVYAEDEDGTWYDELLVHNDKLLVIGYSWRAHATEIAQFSIDDEGIITPGNKFFINSDDYYSGDNYSSRLVDGKLMLYTPLDITELYENEKLQIPLARYWSPENGYEDWQPLFSVTDIYKPIQPTLTPTMHVISSCELDSLQCQSQGVVGPYPKELYVTGEYAYLWLSSDFADWGYEDYWQDDCEPRQIRKVSFVKSAAVYRIDLKSGEIAAVHTNGKPHNQFAFYDNGEALHALLVWEPSNCYSYDVMPLRFVSISNETFSSAPEYLELFRYTRLPTLNGWSLNTQYVSNYLVYGVGQGYWMAYYGDDDDEETYHRDSLYVVDIEQPEYQYKEFLRHSIERLEVLGDNAVAFGYDRNRDFGITTINLITQPVVADTLSMPGLLEYEGRSHAFNALIDDDGSGVMGLPTTKREVDGDNRYEPNPASVDFFRLDRRLQIHSVGALAGNKQNINDDYQCEVSCIDWYGNARPIFIDDRVFALTGSELIEGTLVGDIIDEVNRISLTDKPLF